MGEGRRRAGRSGEEEDWLVVMLLVAVAGRRTECPGARRGMAGGIEVGFAGTGTSGRIDVSGGAGGGSLGCGAAMAT